MVHCWQGVRAARGIGLPAAVWEAEVAAVWGGVCEAGAAPITNRLVVLCAAGASALLRQRMRALPPPFVIPAPLGTRRPLVVGGAPSLSSEGGGRIWSLAVRLLGAGVWALSLWGWHCPTAAWVVAALLGLIEGPLRAIAGGAGNPLQHCVPILVRSYRVQGDRQCRRHSKETAGRVASRSYTCRGSPAAPAPIQCARRRPRLQLHGSALNGEWMRQVLPSAIAWLLLLRPESRTVPQCLSASRMLIAWACGAIMRFILL